jgi:hypothetical protein
LLAIEPICAAVGLELCQYGRRDIDRLDKRRQIECASFTLPFT